MNDFESEALLKANVLPFSDLLIKLETTAEGLTPAWAGSAGRPW